MAKNNYFRYAVVGVAGYLLFILLVGVAYWVIGDAKAAALSSFRVQRYLAMFLFWFTIALLAAIYRPVRKEKIGGLEIPVKRKSAIMDTVVKLDKFRPDLSLAIAIGVVCLIPVFAIAQLAVLFIWPDLAIDIRHPFSWPILKMIERFHVP